MIDYYINCWKQYATFSGRARRKEYWLFYLFNIIACIVLSILDSILGTKTIYRLGTLSSIYVLASIIPNLAVTIRRLHDINRSAWWMLIGFVPLIGALVLFIFMISGGTFGENRFGDDPKEEYF